MAWIKIKGQDDILPIIHKEGVVAARIVKGAKTIKAGTLSTDYEVGCVVCTDKNGGTLLNPTHWCKLPSKPK